MGIGVCIPPILPVPVLIVQCAVPQHYENSWLRPGTRVDFVIHSLRGSVSFEFLKENASIINLKFYDLTRFYITPL